MLWTRNARCELIQEVVVKQSLAFVVPALFVVSFVVGCWEVDKEERAPASAAAPAPVRAARPLATAGGGSRCGNRDQPCCFGDSCKRDDLVCFAGRCVDFVCGQNGDPCQRFENECCAGVTCIDGTCFEHLDASPPP